MRARLTAAWHWASSCASPLPLALLQAGTPMAGSMAVTGLLGLLLCHSAPAAAPRPLLIHNESLAAATWARLATGDAALAAAVRAAEAHAVGHLSTGPFSVVQCASTPPSGDKHDYLSTGVYWWPCSRPHGSGSDCVLSACAHGPCNCSSVDVCGKGSDGCNATTGLPWHSCDGHENKKQVMQGGLPQLGGMGASVQALAAGFYWTRNETFAARAVELITAFFLDPGTKMNPNFRFGQSLGMPCEPPACPAPGVPAGSGSGLVEIDQYLIEVMEAINLISRPAPCHGHGVGKGSCGPSPSWTAELDAAMVEWLTQWSAWMKTTPFSTWACNFYNNHNAACRSSWLAVAAWIGDTELAHKLLVGAKEPQWTNTSSSSMHYQLLSNAPNCAGCNALCSGTCGVAPIGGQILKTGEMPREAERVNGVGYTCAELGNLFRLAQLSRHPIVDGADAASTRAHGNDDLYRYVSRSGSSIRGALDYVVPFALGEEKWPHPSEATDWYVYSYLRQAAAVFVNGTYAQWAEQLQASGCDGASGCAGDASNLWWPSPS